MKTPEIYCDELIEKYKPFAHADCGEMFIDTQMELNNAIQCAIIDVENTIEALENLMNRQNNSEQILIELIYYNEVLTILKTK